MTRFLFSGMIPVNGPALVAYMSIWLRWVSVVSVQVVYGLVHLFDFKFQPSFSLSCLRNDDSEVGILLYY
ncbi:hypothetical protein Hanom_Chr07g00610341 [Helianthus anomalus]